LPQNTSLPTIENIKYEKIITNTRKRQGTTEEGRANECNPDERVTERKEEIGSFFPL
jgi:hypothetical protein